MGNRNQNRNNQTGTPATETDPSEQPAVDETQSIDTPEVAETPEITETPEETPEQAEETPEIEEDTPEEETPEEPAKKQADPKVFWVEGYGNVNAKSQAEAEKKAKKIIEDRRK